MVILDQYAAPTSFDDCLELLDVLVSKTSPAPEQRHELAILLTDLLRRHARRVGVEQRLLLACLLRELDLTSPEELRPPTHTLDTAPLSCLRAKHVALYSLKQNVLGRVSAILSSFDETIRVSTFDDHVGGNPALRAAARTADVFVIATAAAKHAATNFIEAERGDYGVTLKPTGQGSSSMLRALVSHCADGPV
jgi:hypothetical protein